MPREIKSVPVTFANTGIVLRSAPDELPLTAYKALVNVITDRENSISVRKGFKRLNDGLPSAPYGFYFLKDIDGYQWRYAIAGRQLYVAPVTNPGDAAVWPLAWLNLFGAVQGGAGFGGGLSIAADPRPLWATYTLVGGDIKPYIFLCDGQEFLKHPGGLANATRIGIPKPTSGIQSITKEPNTTLSIEDFDDDTEWTADNATIGPTTREGGAACEVTVTGDAAVGGVYKALTSGGYPVIMDLGMQDLTETIEIWFQFATEEAAINCKEIILSFGLSEVGGDTAFQTRFEKAIVPSAFEQASHPGSAGRTSSYDESQDPALRYLSYKQSSNIYDPYSPLYDPYSTWPQDQPSDQNPQDFYNSADQFGTGQPTQMRPGAGVWNRIRIRKDEFTRVGESALTHSELNWNTVTAMRLDIKLIDTATGGKTCALKVDDCTTLLTGKLFGIDYQWTFTYYDSKTNTESDFAEFEAVPYPGAEYDQFRLVFPKNPPNAPPNSNPDTIRLYRIGGSVTQPQLVEHLPYVADTFPDDYVDNIPDTMLSDVLDTDNQLPPDGVKGVELYDDRLWVWGGNYSGVPEPPNRLRFSKNVDVEHFPAGNYIYVGTGSEQIQRCLEHDAELFVFTLTRVYRVIGSGGSYRALATGVNQGLKNPHALCRGLRSLYMYAYDGIYEFPAGRKISEPINQVFFNEVVNEIPPVAVGRESLAALGFYDSKVYFSYCGTTAPWTNGTEINGIFYFTAGGQPWAKTYGTSYWKTRGIWYSGNPYTLAVTTIGAEIPGVPGPPGFSIETIPNDRMLVWDTIYERWHFYLYGSQAMYLEPENNILVGGNLTQWDSIVDGVAASFHYSGAWPMQLETGYADQCQPPDDWRGIFWAIDTRDYDLGAPDQEKRFIDFVVDADTQGEAVNFQVAFDQREAQGGHDVVGIVRTSGRERFVVPCLLGEGDSFLATRAQLRLLANTSPAATAVTRLFKVIHRVLLEPMKHRTFVTDWSDYGTPNPKFFRELWIELDTFGKPLDRIEVQVDQGLAETIAVNTTATGQTKFFYGLTPDLRGNLARLKIVPQGINEVKLYDHGFQLMAEPVLINTIQTPWTDEGHPYNKIWKEVVLDIDTNSLPIGFNFWLDGKIKENFSITTPGRRLITRSLEIDTIGKLGRLTVAEEYLDPTCCLPQGVRIYKVGYVIDPEPADVTIADSYDRLLEWDRYKILRRLWLSMKNPECDVTMKVYVDETLKLTQTIAMDARATGYSKRRFDIPSGLKGKLFRFIFTGAFAFEIYWDRSEWEVKGLNPEDGYQRYRMVPPQTM